MKENSYIPFGSEHCEEIGKTVFIVNSFADRNADKSAEQLILQPDLFKRRRRLRKRRSENA